jgi:hypothetical protein
MIGPDIQNANGKRMVSPDRFWTALTTSPPSVTVARVTWSGKSAISLMKVLIAPIVILDIGIIHRSSDAIIFPLDQGKKDGEVYVQHKCC